MTRASRSSPASSCEPAAEPSTAPCCLIALSRGLPPFAEPLVCADMRGPLSLFGEVSILPKPIGYWKSPVFATLEAFEHQALAGALLLCDSRSGVNVQECRLLPATLFLAGAVSSTFDVAWRLHALGQMSPWGGVLASCQREGRGQVRRAWHSPLGNLYVTFRLPESPLFRTQAAAVIVGAIIAQGLCRLGYSAGMKWPNDLLSLDGKKVGGILLEERGGVLMVGMGLNLVEAPPPTEMRQGAACPAGVLLPDDDEKHSLAAPFPLWLDLVRECMDIFAAHYARATLEQALALAQEQLVWRAQPVELVEEGEATVQGTCLGLGQQGGVLLRTLSGEEREYTSGQLRISSV